MITLGFALVVLAATVVRLAHSGQARRRHSRTAANQLTDEMLEQVAGLVHSYRVMTLKNHFSHQEEVI